MSEYGIIEFKNDNIELSVNVSPKEDTVWLTQKQMSILYDTSVDNVSLHIKNIFKDLELDNSVVEESSVTASDGKKYRFDNEMINLLVKLKWWDKSIEEIKELIQLLSNPDIDYVKEELKNAPIIEMVHFLASIRCAHW